MGEGALVLMEVRAELLGLDQAVATMKDLPTQLRRKATRAAGRKAAKVIADAAQANALKIDRSETPLQIAANVAIQFATRHFKATGDVMFRVGVRGGARKYSNTKENRGKRRVGKRYAVDGSTFYWRFVEFGTSRTRARPFMRPALEANIGRATDVFVAELNRQLDRILKKGR